MTTTFAELNLRSDLLEALASLGYEEPTPIQREAIPPLLAGKDLLGQAATGTGKTAAFALPLLERLGTDRSGAPVALVLVPTRELAVQVSQALHRYGRAMGARVTPIYGGQPITRQLGALSRGVDVVVATPGRALDHIARGSLRLHELQTVVLDEADEMLDMGFAEDLEQIFEATPDEHQTVLFSATMPPKIEQMARRRLRDPERISIARESASEDGAPLVRQSAYIVARAHKPAALGRLLDIEAPAAALARIDQRDGHALAADATRAADAVDVDLGRRRDVVVDHVRHVIDVEAARRDVGRDQHVGLLLPEQLHDAIALLLLHAAVQRLGAVAV